jgi:phenylpropionate dioxygenase-like ring-hydroxylating dioxygenase large terminal subunit
MQQSLQIELVHRVLAHLEAKTTDSDPSGERVDVRAYSDARRLERENEVLFRRLPLAIGHRSELAHPGDFITHDASGTPLLVVRREDGGLDGFINVCRHRGTRVESAPRGNKRAFSCPYHGWTYGKEGRLVTIPHERGFACVDKASRGLVRVAAGEAAGLVFVRPAPLEEGESATLDARTFLGPIADELTGFGLDGMGAAIACERATVRAMSWKLAIDVFLETYHLRTTHKDTIYPLFFDNVGLVDRLGPHLRNVFPKRSIRTLAGTAEADWKLREHANVLYHVFPNTLVLVEPDHAHVLHVWPSGPGTASIRAYMVVPSSPASEKAQRYWQANADILYRATDEDLAMGESIQRGLDSGANRDVIFGAFEHALAHFHREVAQRTQ